MPQQTYQRLLLERAHTQQRWENLASSLTIDDLDWEEIARTREGAIAAGGLDPLVIWNRRGLSRARGTPRQRADS